MDSDLSLPRIHLMQHTTEIFAVRCTLINSGYGMQLRLLAVISFYFFMSSSVLLVLSNSVAYVGDNICFNLSENIL